MTRTMTWAAILSGLTLAAPIAAQETQGTITGTLDLQPATWFVTAAQDEAASGWAWDGNVVEGRLVGQVRRDAAETTEDALTIEFETAGNPTEMNVDAFTISLMRGEDGATYSAGPENADLNFETIVISGESMVVAGSFAGQLIEGGADELVLNQDAPTVSVDGNFQATIPQIQVE